MKKIDITGQIFGIKKVIEYNNQKQRWLCQCIKCGRTNYARVDELRNGKATSCYCIKKIDRKHEDITGQRFGKLVVIRYEKNKKSWLCKCDCGNERYISISALKKGERTSCGCKRMNKYNDLKKDSRFKRLYGVYTKIIGRCYRKKDSNYYRYGARGIKVCDEWLGEEGFNNFFNWSILNGYKIEMENNRNKYAIDRIDNKGNYCPENCRWITQSENSIRTSYVNNKLLSKIDELNNCSEDEMIQNYIKRKMELKQVKPKGIFFYRKPNYCYLHNTDNTKQYLFRNYTGVSIMLGIPNSSISYRVRKKDGYIGEDWKLEKINKESFDELKNKGIEVIR